MSCYLVLPCLTSEVIKRGPLYPQALYLHQANHLVEFNVVANRVLLMSDKVVSLLRNSPPAYLMDPVYLEGLQACLNEYSLAWQLSRRAQHCGGSVAQVQRMIRLGGSQVKKEDGDDAPLLDICL